MRDTDLYGQILGLQAPWFVDHVELDVAKGRVDIRVEHEAAARWRCPQCGRELACRDHADERVWAAFGDVPVRHVRACTHSARGVSGAWRGAGERAWTAARSRFTVLMERWAIDVLKQCATIEGARSLLRLSWDELWGIMSRAVARGRARKQARVMPVIGVDEKAFKKGHSYMTVVCDAQEGCVEYVAEERSAEALSGFWQSLSDEQRAGVEAIVMDMWPAYINSTLEHVPQADEKIVFDRFHIMMHVSRAVGTRQKAGASATCGRGR